MSNLIDSTCGCKGIRTCAICENSERAIKLRKTRMNFSAYDIYIYVDSSRKLAKKIFSASDDDDDDFVDEPLSMKKIFQLSERSKLEESLEDDDVENGNNILECDNVFVVENFVDEREEMELVEKIDKREWILSQSGRRKQDYGPKVNFKHRKLKIDHYTGMPSYSADLLRKMASISQLSNTSPNDNTDRPLSDYVPFELCNLEYDPSRRSCIDFHTDDTWIWGERLISINLLAGSVMSMRGVVDGRPCLLYVPMPRRSLICMAGKMRYEWMHAVLPQHIDERRIALTMREASEVFQRDGELYEKWGRTLIERASNLIEV